MQPATEIKAINVLVKTAYLPEQSMADDEKYVFSYTITIENNSDSPVKLLNRHWVITDANGDTTEVQGEGVIGQQPNILPGQHFTYSSGCILKTPIGTMQGHYQMRDQVEQLFDVDIPVFRLAIPNILN
ncbi:Co2+/Mg2+ efflux protein ApaG [Colwelliaceae bacterium 6471]